MTWLLVAACALASIPAGLRWLRIAQREHYLTGAVGRFAFRWWRSTPLNGLLALTALVGVVGSIYDVRWGFLVAAAQVGPVGLAVKGVTSALAWTARLRRLAVVTGLILTVAYVGGGLIGAPVLVVLALGSMPLIVDTALWLLQPVERRRGTEWVARATAKLASIDPDVVAITGSYGKTTTKSYVAHLLAGSRRVVASPASFNNRMGLARAINENLTPGTEVFIAEMGTYGYGEIAELCEWIPPKVAAMVAIGPVHLERFRTLEHIARAKSEILDRAEVGVICVDSPLLAAIAEERKHSMRIIEVSGRDGVFVAGRRIMDPPHGAFAANVAVAFGICQALGLSVDEVLERIADLPTAEHRQSIIEGAHGVKIVDDTFNSNPAGAMSALAALESVAAGGRMAVITPGMIELGPMQAEENARFAAAVADRVDHLVIVGRTNRTALERGSANGKASVTVVGSRAEAVDWVVANLGPGDAVLYENDLPDHYP